MLDLTGAPQSCALRSVLGKYATALTAQYRDCTREAKPGLRSYETTTTGIPKDRAAEHAGTLANPPTDITTLGFRRRNRRFALSRATASTNGALTLRINARPFRLRCKPSTRRNVLGIPVGGSKLVSIPRDEPT
jgi:hypothetical protein